MKQSLLAVFMFIAIAATGCGSGTTETPKNQNTPAANSSPEKPADGFYSGKGVVTKINNDLGSVELDHEAIEGLMPAMKMEFSVKDKAMLKPIAVGDAVIFTIEHKDDKETIIAIGK
ncbi:MAG: copper-binding protein [Pyrinomonadaceae bacterium]